MKSKQKRVRPRTVITSRGVRLHVTKEYWELSPEKRKAFLESFDKLADAAYIKLVGKIPPPHDTGKLRNSL